MRKTHHDALKDAMQTSSRFKSSEPQLPSERHQTEALGGSEGSPLEAGGLPRPHEASSLCTSQGLKHVRGPVEDVQAEIAGGPHEREAAVKYALAPKRLMAEDAFDSHRTFLAGHPSPAPWARARAGSGIGIAAAERLGLPFGMSLLACASLNAALRAEPVDRSYAGAALGSMALSAVSYCVPQRHKLALWQQSAQSRLRAQAVQETLHVGRAVEAMLDSYVAPMNAFFVIGCALSTTDTPTKAAASVAVMVGVALVFGYFGVKNPNYRSLQSVALATILAAAVAGFGVTMMSARDAMPSLSSSYTPHRARGGADAMTVAGGVLAGALYMRSFFKLRDEVAAARKDIERDIACLPSVDPQMEIAVRA